LRLATRTIAEITETKAAFTVAKKKRQKPVEPDDSFEWGPFRIAQYGKNIVWQSNWPEGEFKKAQQRLVEQFPQVVKEIDELILEIAELVCSLPPEQVLHRAWGEMAVKHMKITAEAEIGEEESVAMRMLDYLQSIIVSHKRSETQQGAISEENWKKLRELVGNLFRKLNFEYQICRSAKNMAEEKDFSQDFEEYRFRAQTLWANVKGDRFQAHERAWLEDVFIPHSVVLQELFGIDGPTFVEEIDKILQALTYGLGDAGVEMINFQQESLDAIEKKIAAHPELAEKDPQEIMEIVVNENGWGERMASVIGRFVGLDLFNVRKVTKLPEPLIKELTWNVSENTTFFADGDFKGWPLRTWPIFQRPFIEIDGEVYCFDLHNLFDHLYRVIERAICRLKPEYRNVWNDVQKKLSEELPFKYLERLLPGAVVHRNVHYRWHIKPDGNKEWCELDGLVLYDDHLFVVEVRAGAFTQAPPATDFDSYVASLKNLVLKPVTQGLRFVEYLGSEENVGIFDQHHKKVGELRKSDYRHVTVCPVTLDPFTELAAQVQHLRKIGVDVGAAPIWAVSIDDLRAFGDIFGNPLTFLHFVEQRKRAAVSTIVQPDDELDHVALYVEHNNYTQYAEELTEHGLGKLNFHGYRSQIDKFFSAKLQNGDTPSPIQQKMPPRLREVVEFLTKSAKPGRTRLASYLLDLSGEWRDKTFEAIDNEIKEQPERGRPKPFSSHGGVRTTVFVHVHGVSTRNTAFAVNHTQAVMLVGSEADRLLVELNYSADGVLEDVNWQDVDVKSLAGEELEARKAEAEKLRTARLANAKRAFGKIGRNEMCPCGSGKKYKKCCLNRN
jgi:hypothetical protein